MLGRVFMSRYETIRLLGEGGMGRVYLARQLDLGRQVVVKVMHDHIAADPRFRDRFARETLLMARFQHPYAVTLYDASLDDPEGPCIVMEYIRGVTLDTVLANNHGRLEPARVGRLLRQMCEVLQAAHGEGIVHRDLKPANLMVVDSDTPYELLKVMDFGLAKLVSNENDPSVSDEKFNNVTAADTEFAVGSPGYMCPEQARGEPMDHRGDLYSVGMILYEMLTGRLPFSGRSTMDMLLAHATEDPPPFAHFAPMLKIPPMVERLVHSCLAKSPEERPGTARELAENYEAALTSDGTTLVDGNRGQATVTVPVIPRLSPRISNHDDAPRPAPPAPAPVANGGSAQANLKTGFAPVVPSLPPIDASTIVHHLEAWMPEKIATFKLRGFIHDAGGEVMESVPGRIRLRLGGRGSIYAIPGRGSFAWLGLNRRASQIDVELRLNRGDSNRDNHLRITVVLKPMGGADLSADAGWRHVCNQIYCDLRGHLMGQTGPVATDPVG
jgi:eukaryotic-like serine/threonine-protein kinase